MMSINNCKAINNQTGETNQLDVMRVAIDLLPAKVPGRELDAVVGELAQIDPVGGGDGKTKIRLA